MEQIRKRVKKDNNDYNDYSSLTILCGLSNDGTNDTADTYNLNQKEDIYTIDLQKICKEQSKDYYAKLQSIDIVNGGASQNLDVIQFQNLAGPNNLFQGYVQLLDQNQYFNGWYLNTVIKNTKFTNNVTSTNQTTGLQKIVVPDQLYNFQISTNYTFTSCGQFGYQGPTEQQIQQQYNGTIFQGFITTGLFRGYQQLTIPYNATYTFTLVSPVSQLVDQLSNIGIDSGFGVTATITLPLYKGDKILMIIGQQPEDLSWPAGGGSAPQNGGYGGCGGTFLYKQVDGYWTFAACVGGPGASAPIEVTERAYVNGITMNSTTATNGYHGTGNGVNGTTGTGSLGGILVLPVGGNGGGPIINNGTGSQTYGCSGSGTLTSGQQGNSGHGIVPGTFSNGFEGGVFTLDQVGKGMANGGFGGGGYGTGLFNTNGIYLSIGGGGGGDCGGGSGGCSLQVRQSWGGGGSSRYNPAVGVTFVSSALQTTSLGQIVISSQLTAPNTSQLYEKLQTQPINTPIIARYTISNPTLGVVDSVNKFMFNISLINSVPFKIDKQLLRFQFTTDDTQGFNQLPVPIQNTTKLLNNTSFNLNFKIWGCERD